MDFNKASDATKPEPPKENFWANLILNIIIPTLILTKGSGDEALGPTLGVIVALAFPIAYGVYDFKRSQKINIFSAIGVVSVLLSGSMLVLKAPPEYIAIKEAAVPGLIGIALAVLTFTRYSPIRFLLFNERHIRVDQLSSALAERGAQAKFEKAVRLASLILAGSFFLSSALNYILAKVLLKSAPGTEAFNAEYGKMMAMSFPVITIPSTLMFMVAVFYLFWKIDKLTGISFDELFIAPETKKSKSNP